MSLICFGFLRIQWFVCCHLMTFRCYGNADKAPVAPPFEYFSRFALGQFVLHVLLVNKEKIMSRKSLPRKDQIIWYLCTKCESNIYVKDRDQHSEYCPAIESTTCTIIRDKQVLSARLSIQTITDDLRGLNAKHFNGFVFLSESVFGLCDFVLGDNVLVSSDALPNGVPIVRSVWPSTSSASLPTAVSVTEEGMSLHIRYLSRC